MDPYEAAMASSDEEDTAKKDKKLVFLSRTVLKKVRERPMVTGTQIANEIFQLYSNFVDVSFISSLTTRQSQHYSIKAYLSIKGTWILLVILSSPILFRF